MWKEVAVALFETEYQHFSEGTEKKHKFSGQQVFKPRFKPKKDKCPALDLYFQSINSFCLHSYSRTMAWWWPTIDVETSCQIINIHNRVSCTFVIHLYIRYTFVARSWTAFPRSLRSEPKHQNCRATLTPIH